MPDEGDPYAPTYEERQVQKILEKIKGAYIHVGETDWVENRPMKFHVYREVKKTCPACKNTESEEEKIGYITMKRSYTGRTVLVNAKVPGLKLREKKDVELEVVYD